MAKTKLSKEGLRVLGSKNPKPIKIPSNRAVPRLDFGNCILEVRATNYWRTYFAFGKVIKICKSDNFDLVYVDFGRGKDKCCKVYFHSLLSRKQIYTLKVGQYAQFGMIRSYDDAKRHNDLYVALWTMGIYVPKIVDIRNSELTEEEIETMSEEDYGEGLTFLDLFKKND